jgi:hypothetical protein
MVGADVHFEVFVRKKAGDGWSLEMASENRALAISTAEELMAEGRVAAAKVTKETLDEETREFRTVTILNLGAPDTAKKSKVKETSEPLCVTPQDLYTIHARERIGRLLEAWLQRNNATPSNCCTVLTWWSSWRSPAPTCSTPSRRSPFPRPRPAAAPSMN